MGNSDSKPGKGSIQSTPSSQAIAQQYMRRVQTRLESEFDKRADIQLNALTRDSFHACLRKVQDEFGLFNISGSPLSTGLFESCAVSHPGGKHVMTKDEYATAMGLIFHNCGQSVLISATTQAILKWYAFVKDGTAGSYPRLTDDILVSFFEASWRFAWSELINRKLSSNSRLNGKAETEAIQRFVDAQAKYFSAHEGELKLYDPSSSTAPTVDRSITARVGEDYVIVPTSFSFVTRNSAVSPRASGRILSDSPSSKQPNNGRVLYPDL